MPQTFKNRNKIASVVWRQTLDDILSYGFASTPRGKSCVELIGNQTIVDMRYPIVTNKARNLGYKFMAAEAYWILSGDNRVETIKNYSQAISSFSDDGVTFFGAYGPKIVDQIDYVVAKLLEDPSSRQAVINIWRENPPKTKDVPCTLSLQFVIRDRSLCCIATMRSSDIWLGWPYDVFNFSMISATVLLKLIEKREALSVIDLGLLFLTAGSQHFYDTNAHRAMDCLVAEDGTEKEFDICVFESSAALLDYLKYAKDKNTSEWIKQYGIDYKFL